MKAKCPTTPEHRLFIKAGKNQRVLLYELWKQGIIRQGESDFWIRGPIKTACAKELLCPEDKTIAEKIAELEPLVIRLEKDAKAAGITLKGGAREKLEELIQLRDAIYTEGRLG